MPLKLVRNDITKMEVGAIVNSANPRVLVGAGVDTAIHRAAGPELLAARAEIGRLHAGQVAITPAFALPSRYVIHAVAPNGDEPGALELLRNCYAGAITLARQNGCQSIAFPLLAAGSLGCPRELALRVARETIAACLAEHDMYVYLVIFDDKTFVLSRELTADIESYVSANYVEEQLEEEYFSSNYRERREQRGWLEEKAQRLLNVFEAREPDPKRKPAKRPRKEEAEDEELRCFSVESSQLPPPPPAGAASVPVRPRSLGELISEAEETFSQRLLRMIEQRGEKAADIYKGANITRAHFSKIRNNPDYQPKKPTAVAFAIALRLSLDDTLDLLGRAGYTLSRSSYFDLIIRYYIERGNYDIFDINDTLFNYKQPTLG